MRSAESAESAKKQKKKIYIRELEHERDCQRAIQSGSIDSCDGFHRCRFGRERVSFLHGRGKYAHGHRKHKIPRIHVSGSPRFITRESSGPKGAVYNGPANCGPVYTDGDVTASSAMRTNKCEIRCIHNAKGCRREAHPPPLPRCTSSPGARCDPSSFALPPVPPTSLYSARCKSIRHATDALRLLPMYRKKQSVPSPTLRRKYCGFRGQRA